MFGKPSNVTQEKFQRADHQPVMEAMLAHVLAEHGIAIGSIDFVHGRRTIRATLRVAAKIARRLGCDARTFALLAIKCFEDERAIGPRAEA